MDYRGNLYLTKTPLYWKEAQVKGLFSRLDLAEVVVKKMSWFVGTLRTSTDLVQVLSEWPALVCIPESGGIGTLPL